MKTYIALFRGINVGGRNILPMKDLVKILEDLGCSKVRTYIQSGNVVFNTEEDKRDKLAVNISEAIADRYKFKPKVLLLEAAELETAIKNNPFDTDAGKALHFFFLESLPKSPDLEGLTANRQKLEYGK